MPRFRIKDLSVDLPLGGGQGQSGGGCGSVTNPCLGCTGSWTIPAAAQAAGECGFTLCGGCSHITNPCLGCTHAVTICGGCSHVTNPCLGCTHVVTLCGGCSIVTNPCLGCTHQVTFDPAQTAAAACGGCSQVTNPCLGCTHSITVANVQAACGACTVTVLPVCHTAYTQHPVCPGITHCLPWTIGPVCAQGFTHHPGLGPDPAQLAALKEQLRAQLQQIVQHEAGGGLPSDPAQAAELEERLQEALDEVRQHRARLEQDAQDDEDGQEKGG